MRGTAAAQVLLPSILGKPRRTPENLAFWEPSLRRRRSSCRATEFADEPALSLRPAVVQRSRHDDRDLCPRRECLLSPTIRRDRGRRRAAQAKKSNAEASKAALTSRKKSGRRMTFPSRHRMAGSRFFSSGEPCHRRILGRDRGQLQRPAGLGGCEHRIQFLRGLGPVVLRLHSRTRGSAKRRSR